MRCEIRTECWIRYLKKGDGRGLFHDTLQMFTCIQGEDHERTERG